MSEIPFIADLVLSGGTVVSSRARFKADVAIKDGLIALVGAPEAMPQAREIVDVSGKFVLPGAIDMHVHFREPGYTHKEDWRTGTAVTTETLRSRRTAIRPSHTRSPWTSAISSAS